MMIVMLMIIVVVIMMMIQMILMMMSESGRCRNGSFPVGNEYEEFGSLWTTLDPFGPLFG